MSRCSTEPARDRQSHRKRSCGQSADGLDRRIGHLVLVACETVGNYPPALPGTNLVLLTNVPGSVALAWRGMRFKPMRRLPFAFGWMTKHGVPDDLVERWLDAALNDCGVVGDALKCSGAGTLGAGRCGRVQLLDYVPRSFCQAGDARRGAPGVRAFPGPSTSAAASPARRSRGSIGP
jgi:hypothetical protein